LPLPIADCQMNGGDQASEKNGGRGYGAREEAVHLPMKADGGEDEVPSQMDAQVLCQAGCG